MNSPGIVSTTATVIVRFPAGRRTTTAVCVRPATAYGTITLIWPGPANVTGAATPSNVTDTPSTAVGIRPSAPGFGDCGADGPIPVPNSDTISPGATSAPAVPAVRFTAKLAAW